MKYVIIFFLFVCVYSCEQKQTSSPAETKDSVTNVQISPAVNEYLITDTSFGKINKTTTYTDLQAMFGNANMQDTIDYAAEGLDSFIVTKIFSNTPKEVVVTWQFNKFHKAIRTVDCYRENSPYQTIDSIRVGSTLEKLVQVNGKKINFYGTGWDYGGLITSWNNGKFEKSNLFFSLNSRDDASDDIIGDRELITDQPKVKANLRKLYIAKISLSLHNEK